MAVTRGSNTIHFDALNDSVPDKLVVTGMQYHGGTTIGHECELDEKEDGSGVQIFHAIISTANKEVTMAGMDIRLHGCKVTKLDSGELHLYHK